MASASASAQASLALAVVSAIARAFAYGLRASDERTTPEAESKAEAVDSCLPNCQRGVWVSLGQPVLNLDTML